MIANYLATHHVPLGSHKKESLTQNQKLNHGSDFAMASSYAMAFHSHGRLGETVPAGGRNGRLIPNSEVAGGGIGILTTMEAQRTWRN
jgi:hypothetical protein